MKRLLTIGHSYVVAANRRLAHHMALQGRGEWEVTAVAPRRYRGDLRLIDVEPIEGEANTLRTVPVRLDGIPHLMTYAGDTVRILSDDWDVVHCWEEPYTRSAAQIARGVRARAALVFASFQNISKRYPWPLRAYERTSMTRANGWIAFGETVRGALHARPGYAGKSMRVIPPGVDLRHFGVNHDASVAMRARLGWPADAFVVGYLGRFVEQKGIGFLMEVMEGTQADWRALFVGGGVLEPSLRDFAAKHPGRVHVQTGVPHDEVPDWLNAMSVLCAPSRTTPKWREQFGRMLIEAMACGVVVVASDSGEMPFVVGDAGVIAPEGDVTAWRGALTMLTGAAARSAYVASGLRRVERQYDWSVVARRHLDFFSEVSRS